MSTTPMCRRQPLRGLLFVACLLLGISSVVAKDVETTAEGVGADQNIALADALARAVSQVNGVSTSLNVSTGSIELTERSNTTDSAGQSSSGSTKRLGVTPDANLRAHGRITRYEVLKSETLADGMVRLTVRAFVQRPDVHVYTAPGSSAGKKRVAVFPVLASSQTYEFFGLVDGGELAAELAMQIESSLLDAGEVSLLDRRSLGASLLELGLVGSRLTSDSERAKLRQFRGADLVLLTTLQDARYAVTTWEVPSTGQRRTAVDVALEVDVRAVVPATGELLLARKFSVNDASNRAHALAQIAAYAAHDVVRLLTGKATPLPVHRAAVTDLPAVIEPVGPRRSGVRLPNDP